MAAADHLGQQFDKVMGTKTDQYVGMANHGQWTGGSRHPRPDIYHVTGYRMMRPGDEEMIYNQTAHQPWIGNN